MAYPLINRHFLLFLKHKTILRFVENPLKIYSIHCRRTNHTSRNILRLSERGMIQELCPSDVSDEIIDVLNGKPQCVYSGFDPTAKSLHIGNLLVLIHLLHWQRAGHRVIAVIGGATAQIGDPSGRTKDRPTPDLSVVQEQVTSLRENIKRIFDNHQAHFWDATMDHDITPVNILNNNDWYRKINVVEFVGTVGRHFRMAKMLGRESVSKRLASEYGMSFTEFTYQIFQAYDWLYLLEKYGCTFQVGGSDQLGNIFAGHHLIGRTTNKEVYGMMLPLITNSAGEKFGKSEIDAIWLDPKMTTPFNFYQYLVRTSDNDVEKYLKLFSFDSVPSIEVLIRKHRLHPERKIAQKKLADDLTLLVHGEKGLDAAKNATSILYEKDISALCKLSQEEMQELFQGATTIDLMLKPYTIMNFAMDVKCFSTENDARRIIPAGGFYVNHQRVVNPNEMLSKSVHILPNNLTLVRVGKRNYWIVRWV